MLDVDLALGDVDVPELRMFFGQLTAELETGEHWAQVGYSPSSDQIIFGTMEGLDVAMAEAWASITA